MAPCFALVHVSRGDPEAAERAVQAGREEGSAPLELRTVEALLSVLAGRGEEARAQLNEVENSTGVIAVGSILAMASAYARLGDVESALRWADRPLVRQQFATTIRLLPELHPLLDHPPFAPRRREDVLVWPLEAPPVDAARQGLFRGMRIESGIPHGSELLGSFA